MRAREGIEMDGAEPCLRASFLCVCSVLFVLSCRREGCLPPAWPGMDNRNYSDRRQTNGQVLFFSGLMTRRGIFGEYIIATTTTNHHNCFFKTLSSVFFLFGVVWFLLFHPSFPSLRFGSFLLFLLHNTLASAPVLRLLSVASQERRSKWGRRRFFLFFVSFRFVFCASYRQTYGPAGWRDFSAGLWMGFGVVD